MKTQIEQPENWGMRSVSYWFTLTIAIGIIFIGLRFIFQPQTGAAGYGIPITDIRNAAYGKIKGIRDIFSGIVLLPLLIMRMRKAVAWVFTAATIVPAADFIIVMTTNGTGDFQHLMIHSLTTLFMIFNSFLLFKSNTASAQS